MTATKVAPWVLDSWSVMAYLEDEPAGAAVEQLLVKAQAQGVPVLMSVVNASEVWYIVARETSPAEADQTLVELRQLGIEFLAADWALAHAAAQLKTRGNIALADCFAAALAQTHQAPLVTGDKEFKQVEDVVIVHWLKGAK